MTVSEPTGTRTTESTAAVGGGPDDAERDAGPGFENAREASLSLLDDAVRRVAAEYDEGAQSQLAKIVELIEDGRDRGSAAEIEGQATALRLRLLDQIRRRLLTEGPQDGAVEAELLGVLRSLEATREALESDWARRFGLVLAGPHGVEVAAEIAHGLRSACASLLFTSEVLRDEIFGELNERQREQLAVLNSAAVAVSASLSDITELSWRTEEPGDGTPDAFSLEEVADSVRSLLEPVAAARGSEIAFDLGARPQRRGHPRALRQALVNLVLHAVLEGGGGGTVSVEIGNGEGEEAVYFRIGSGGSDSRKITGGVRYQILREGANDGSIFSISSLRLHVARHLVRALGGELQHETDDGDISAWFTLTLPVRSCQDEGA